VVIDFSGFAPGSKLYLKETAAQFVGNPSPDVLPAGLAIENVLMQFNVVPQEWWFPSDTPDFTASTQLTTYPTLPAVDVNFEWQFVRDPATANPRLFRINNRAFDAGIPAHCILRDNVEEWLLNNDVGAPAWTHPVHIHFEEFRTFELFHNGISKPVQPLMSGRKDVMRLEANQGARIRMQFRDFIGKYLIHCHNMNHEDAFMMVRWDICQDQAALNQCIQDSMAQLRKEDERLAEAYKLDAIARNTKEEVA
jgi:FtsP/CotA-like multicopper oxidase with cupredoxin domain